MRRVLVFGASGAVGRFLLRRLQAGGLSVVALSRQPQAPMQGVAWLCDNLDNARFELGDIDGIVSAGPLDRFVAWLERTPTVPSLRVVALSSMSAASKLTSVDAAERALAQHLGDCELRLQQRCESQGTPWTILRPTLIYGAGLDRSLSVIVSLARLTRLFPRIRAARGLRQPVHADDVAAACVASLHCSAAAGCRLELGGDERLSFALMLERVRSGTDTATLPLPLPISLLRVAALLSGRGNGMVQRLNRDLIADNEPARQLLNYRPRTFQPGPDCWPARTR